MKPTFFPTPAKWRAWLARHHGQENELLVGFYKRDPGKPSIMWPESVDQALCFCWWVVSAKKEETRLKRLQTLIARSAKGELLPGTRVGKTGKR